MRLDPVSVAVLGWVFPGSGHLVLGRWQKATLYFVLVVGTLIAGWLISGREDVYFASGRWHVLLQVGAGLVTFLIGLFSTVPEPKLTVMHYFEIGTLYTMVAGLLNVLVVMDAVMTCLKARKARR